ncbi:C-C chemokine receptor type 5-like [Silurus meridionalis]|nr:C-C chemokine receptor type 5-like [Silurus meridionalis]
MTTTEMYSTADYSDYTEPCIQESALNPMAMAAVFYLVFALGLLGNSMLLWMLLKIMRIKTMTDVCLLNLAVSDLITVFSLPLWALSTQGHLPDADWLCKLMVVTYQLGFYSGILFVMLISIDRYLAIVHAVASLGARNLRYAVTASFVIWTVSFCAAFPASYFHKMIKDENLVAQCEWDPGNGSVKTSSTEEDFEFEIDGGVCDYGQVASHILPVLYSVFIVVGLLGNLLVLWVILKGAQLKSMTDVSLLNLTIADLLLIFTLPFLAHSAGDTWVFGNGMCTLVLGVYYIGFYSGIFFIVLMSIDRYLAIVHAVFALRIRTRAYGIFASIFVWILAVIASFPELLYLGVEKNGTVICSAYPKDASHNNVRSGAFFKMNVLGLLIPLIIVGFCYSMVLRKLQTLRNSTKLAVRLVIVVMVVFFCCWIPYNIAAFLKALELKLILTPECELSKKIQLLLQVTEAVAYSHSCLNPFLYVLVGEKFRRHLARLLLHTPCSHVQCMKVYMTRAASSVYSQSTSMEERSTAH